MDSAPSLVPVITMALTVQQLQASLDALVTALGSPTLSCRFADGRMVTYRSIAEIKAAISEITNQIEAVSGGARSRVGFAQHKRGDGPGGPSSRCDRW